MLLTLGRRRHHNSAQCGPSLARHTLTLWSFKILVMPRHAGTPGSVLNQGLLIQPSLEELHSMLRFVERYHMPRTIDTNVSQRSTLPPETTSPNLLVVLLLVSEIGQALPRKRPEDSFIANEIANLPKG